MVWFDGSNNEDINYPIERVNYLIAESVGADMASLWQRVKINVEIAGLRFRNLLWLTVQIIGLAISVFGGYAVLQWGFYNPPWIPPDSVTTTWFWQSFTGSIALFTIGIMITYLATR